MKKLCLFNFIVLIVFSSCVSQKKYTELEDNYLLTKDDLRQSQTELIKTKSERDDLERQINGVKDRVANFKDKLRTLKDINNNQMTSIDDIVVMSNTQRARMRETLKHVDPSELANAKTATDSMNLAISHNLKKSISDTSNNDEIDINIEETVVVINISDKFLFNTGSYKLNKNSTSVLGKLATVLNQQPGMDVLVEGHTDSRSIKNTMFRDNWDLSVKRAASIVQILQNKFKVDPTRLIAAGRSSYKPIMPNDSKEHMAKNRRTRIIILPELERFFELLNP